MPSQELSIQESKRRLLKNTTEKDEHRERDLSPSSISDCLNDYVNQRDKIYPLDPSGELCKERGLPKNPKTPKKKEKKGMPRNGDNVSVDVLLNKTFYKAAELSSTEEIAYLHNMRNRADERIAELEAVVPLLPAPDSTGKSYKLFVPRSDCLRHLEIVWGTWLKYFNPEQLDRDYLFQDQLKERDPKLVAALRSRFKNDFKAGKTKTKFAEVLPNKYARAKVEIAELDPNIQKKLSHLGRVAYNNNI